MYAVGGESMCGEVLRGELVVCVGLIEIFQAAPSVATMCWLPMMVWQSVCFNRAKPSVFVAAFVGGRCVVSVYHSTA